MRQPRACGFCSVPRAAKWAEDSGFHPLDDGWHASILAAKPGGGNANAGRHRGGGAGGADAVASAASRRHFQHRHRGPQPRLLRGAGARRPDGELGRADADRHRRRRAVAARGDGARRHLHLVQGRGAAHRLPQADRQAGVHLRPEGGRHRPDRQASRRRRADFLRGFGHQRSRFRRRQAENPLPPSRASRRRSNAISSAAATASTASAGRAFRPAC